MNPFALVFIRIASAAGLLYFREQIYNYHNRRIREYAPGVNANGWHQIRGRWNHL